MLYSGLQGIISNNYRKIKSYKYIVIIYSFVIIMKKENPFSAEHPVPPPRFAGRNKQIKDFEMFLDDTIGGNPKNIAVLGDWGIGKTSLLWKFKHIAENRGCVGTIIQLDRSITSYATLLETIIHNLVSDAKHKRGLSSKIIDTLDTLSLTIKYGGFRVGIKKGEDVTPSTIKFEDDITKIYKQMDTPFLIMLDNVEEIFRLEGSLFSLRNIFQMLQSIKGNIRCMLIIAGKESLFRDIMSGSEPVARFFWAVGLKQFKEDETKEAVMRALKDTGVVFNDEVISMIHEKSKGHPYFVQAISYVLYRNATSNNVGVKDFEQNYKDVVNFLGFRLFKSLFDSITKTEQKILLGFLKSDEKVLTNKELKKFTEMDNVNTFLKRLNEHPIPLILKEERGKYKLFHPLFKEYLKSESEK